MISKVYLAGPMTGLPEYNYPAFNDMAARLRRFDYEVLNPAENFGGDTTREYHEYMRVNIAALMGCQSVALLDGWKNSDGAMLEVIIARALFIPVFEVCTVGEIGFIHTPMEEDISIHVEAKQHGSILDDAKSLVHGDRQGDYGHPKVNIQRIAELWRPVIGKEITPSMVCMCMILVKLSRLIHGYKRDSVVDIAGYAELLGIVNP